MFCNYGVRVLWNPFFCFVTNISISLMIIMLNYVFTHILFSLRILRLAVKMSDKQAFRSQTRQITVTDPIWVIIKKWRNPERLNHKKISVKIFKFAATFILNIHGGTNIENMRSLTRRIMGQLIILCLLLRLKCQCSHKQTFYN